ncbi:TetR/AcrR family transcriptional regulator [Lentzea sp. NPDC051213]|uniref:TetR/AcrR family transcriptional regulator n=1 Tax=Lentzea sp. NPDC051213 TaxID=3364126 RepID=UPI00378F2838
MAATRGRRRAFDQDEVLEQVTLAFWRSGYDSTSMSDLTRITGVNPPSMYAAFGDKRALFGQVVGYYQRTYGAFTVRALDEEPTARRAIERMLAEAAVSYTDSSHPQGCLVISAASNPTAVSSDVVAQLRELREAGRDAIEAKIRHDVDEGVLPSTVDAHGLAVFFAATIQGMSGQARDGASTTDLERVAELAMHAWPESSDARQVAV